MDLGSLNWIAIIAAALAGMAIGAFWYSTLGSPWMAGAGLSKDDIKSEPKLYIIAGFCQFVMAFSMASLIAHFGDPTIANGIMSAVVIWVGFVITTMTVNHRFQGAPWALTFIDGGHWLAVLLAMGIIIGLLG